MMDDAKQNVVAAQTGLFIDCGARDGRSVIAFLLEHPQFDCMSFEGDPAMWSHFDGLPTELVRRPASPEVSDIVRRAAGSHASIVLKLDVGPEGYDILGRMLDDGTLDLVGSVYAVLPGAATPEQEIILKRAKQVRPIRDWNAQAFALEGADVPAEQAADLRTALVRAVTAARQGEATHPDMGGENRIATLMQKHVQELELFRQDLAERKEEIRTLYRSVASLSDDLATALRKKKRLQKVATILAIPYALITFPISLPIYLFLRLRKRRKLEVELRVIDDLRFKLETLGFSEPAAKDLEALAENGNEPQKVRAHAAREVVLYNMRRGDEESLRKALRLIGEARRNASTSRDFHNTLATTEVLCHHLLGDEDAGRKAYKRIRESSIAAPDAMLAWTNYQPTPEERVTVINEVLKQFDITPLALLPDETLAPYDRLTSGTHLPERHDGPKVTVLIAAYEAQDTLATAIRSMQEQTWKNLEILVIDDCSPTDLGAGIAEGMAEGDPRIRVIRMPENCGAYVARNRGLDEATGDYVTLHDADDWTHPKRIETQVAYMEDNRDVMGTTTQQARANPDLCFTRWTGRGRFITTNISSFMFRTNPVRERLGHWDTVRFSADRELIHRIQADFGSKSVKNMVTGPLAFQRNSESSIVADDVLGINGFLYGARKEYRDAQEHFHASSGELKYDGNPETRPFPAPRIMLPNRESAKKRVHFPVVIGSELRMQGGSVHSCIQEIRATRAAGHRVGLFQMFRYDLGLKTRRSMLPEVRDLVDGQSVETISYGAKISCDLLVLRYPPILEHHQRYVPDIDARAIKVVVNQPPVSDYSERGIRRYYLEHCARNTRHYFGKDAVWHPNGPMVREALVTHHADELRHIELSPDDWDNIIDLDDWRRPERPKHGRLRIGRHSRDSYVKWPDKKKDILDAYPEAKDLEVHVLGGATTPSGLIGRTPGNWVVHKFGAMSPKEFLAGIDVFIFFAHPQWVESFPRTVLEAMAVGVPVILPESHRALFGDRALYATPQTAADVARKLYADPEAYDAQVQKAWDYLEQHYSYAMHARRLAEAGVRPE